MVPGIETVLLAQLLSRGAQGDGDMLRQGFGGVLPMAAQMSGQDGLKGAVTAMSPLMALVSALKG